MLLKTPLYDFHKAYGRLVEFAGFEMPVWYRGAVDECHAVRNDVGIFDVSHMGRAFVTGKDAQDFLDYLTPNDVASLKPLQVHYTVLSNERGGIVDDVVILRLEEQRFLIVFNASNRQKDLEWLRKKQPRFEVELNNISDSSAMIAVQGPKAKELMDYLIDKETVDIPRFGCGQRPIDGVPCVVSGTGYTGERGYEVVVPDTSVGNPEKAVQVWNRILEAGKPFNIMPCGLGARDVLRLEAGMCLYGNDIDEETTPLEARIGFVVKLDKKSNFIGRDVLMKQKAEGAQKVRVGLKVKEGGIPRAGFSIMKDGGKVGTVTSGTYSPLLRIGIAMGYVRKEYSNLGTSLQIDVRGRLAESEVTQMPFYDMSRYGWKRITGGASKQ